MDSYGFLILQEYCKIKGEPRDPWKFPLAKAKGPPATRDAQELPKTDDSPRQGVMGTGIVMEP